MGRRRLTDEEEFFAQQRAQEQRLSYNKEYYEKNKALIMAKRRQFRIANAESAKRAQEKQKLKRSLDKLHKFAEQRANFEDLVWINIMVFPQCDYDIRKGLPVMIKAVTLQEFGRLFSIIGTTVAHWRTKLKNFDNFIITRCKLLMPYIGRHYYISEDIVKEVLLLRDMYKTVNGKEVFFKTLDEVLEKYPDGIKIQYTLNA